MCEQMAREGRRTRMGIETMTGASKKFALPETAVPIETVLDYTIVIAEMILDVKAICDQFKQKEEFTRQDVKDFIAANKQDILGLDTLEKAIKEKKGDQKAKRIMGDVYDEMIDKMVGKKLLSFHVALSVELEI